MQYAQQTTGIIVRETLEYLIQLPVKGADFQATPVGSSKYMFG